MFLCCTDCLLRASFPLHLNTLPDYITIDSQLHLQLLSDIYLSEELAARIFLCNILVSF